MRLLPLVVAVILTTAGCTDSSDSSDSDTPASPEVVEQDDARASAPPGTATPVVPADFNPCSGIRLPPVARALGAALTKDLGDADNPRCGLLPGTSEGPVLTVTYQPFDGGLDAVLTGMGEDPKRVSELEVPGADDARLLVAFDDAEGGRGAFVTGFIQVGGLVEVVNAADPPPYQGTHLARAVTVVLRQLAAAPR